MSGDLTYGVPFAARHIGPSQDGQRRMLDAIGYSSVEELMDAAIPEVIRWQGTIDLPPAASEAEVLAELRAIADKNTVAVSMIRLGYYGTFTPA
jgi:glycine dehydrogenase